MPAPDDPRPRLRATLTSALKSRDRAAAAALRTAIAAIDNAEAVDLPASGDGPSEVDRRDLSPAEIRRILIAEIDDLRAGAADYRALGQHNRADELDAGAAVIVAALGDGTG